MRITPYFILKKETVGFFLSFLPFLFLQNSYSNEINLKELSEKKEWKALLHFFESDNSEILPKSDFFISNDGHKNPLSELNATLLAFKDNNTEIGPLKQKPLCALPARRAFFEKNGFKFKDEACPDLNRFIESINPHSLSLVFSTNYAGNPASLFGHTLIRINQNKIGNLRDYAVNFSAEVPPGEIGLKYIPFGLLGLYPGFFKISPYYIKVLEYNEAESRDLWEYELNYSKDEVHYWLNHLWEIRWLASFSYTFLKKNCSYQINRTLEVIRPELGSLLPTYNFYTLPGETIRFFKMNHPDLIREINFRPSHKRILNHETSELTKEELIKLRLLLDNLSKNKDSIHEPKVLEAAIQRLEYKKIEEQNSHNEALNSSLRSLRLKRSELPAGLSFSPVQKPVDPTNQPDLTHGSRSISLNSAFGSNSSSELTLRARAGIHDRLERDSGNDPSFSITGLDFELSRILKENRFHIRRFELLQLSSWDYLKEGDYPLSWGFFTGWVPFEEPQTELEFSSYFKAKGHIGFTNSLLKNNKLNSTTLLSVEGDFDRKIDSKKSASLLFEQWLIIRIKSELKFSLNATLQSDRDFKSVAQSYALESSYFFHPENSLRMSVKRIEKSYFKNVNGNLYEFKLNHFF